MSQSIWSVSEYQVKPRIGMPLLRTRKTFAHSFHSQYTASSPLAALVEICLRVHHRQPVTLVILAGDFVVAEHFA